MIEIKNLRKEYKANGKTLAAIEDINLYIGKGEFVSIVGPSGCGKTTLLKIVAGLLSPTNGAILLNKREQPARRLGIVFQNPVLLPWRNLKHNIRLPTEINKEADKNIANLIAFIGLKGFEDHYPHELSGGMQQRAAIARALASNSELLLMDEPFGSLDEIKRGKLNLELLRVWKELGLTILFVTHSITEAVFLSDKVVVLSERPSKIKGIVNVQLPRPRDLDLKESLKFQRYVKCIREKLG